MSAQNDTLQIYNISTDTLYLCSDSIVVGSGVMIDGNAFNEESEGIKVSIVNYRKGEDTLVYYGPGNLKSFWDNNKGTLAITGIANDEDYRAAVREVYYKNLKEIPNLGIRELSITLIDADYLPYTQHFYRYIPALDISWQHARDSASKMSYNGLEGYLATITSSIENDFIWSKIDGVGWIGASDSVSEGHWYWVTGPEAGTEFWYSDENNGYPINNLYSFWSTGEPNNMYTETNNGKGEDYAHINQNPDREPKSWNDLRNNGNGPNGGYYRPQGFVVEFGDMPNDPEVRLVATVNIDVNKIAFSKKREYTICQGDGVELNLVAPNGYFYSWSPPDNLSAINISNPFASPSFNSKYKVIGTYGSCADTAEFRVNVNPLPQHQWEPEYTICKGEPITLDPGEHDSYLWENGDTTHTYTTTEEGRYSVEISNEFGCSSTGETEVKWSLVPAINFNNFNSLVCGAKQQQLEMTFDQQGVSSEIYAREPNVTILDPLTYTPEIIVGGFGKYTFEILLTDEANCQYTDTLNIEFHNQPTAQFQIDEAECEGYNLKLFYQGITYEDALFNWYSNDTVYFSGINADTMTIPLGYGIMNRTVGLKIDEQGCTDSTWLPVTVTPILNFWPEGNEGCTSLDVSFKVDATEPVENYLWNFGDYKTSNVPEPSHTFFNDTTIDKTFDINLTITSAEGCENTGTLYDIVIVHPTPTTGLNIDESFCYDDSVEVIYAGSANNLATYNWDISDFKDEDIINDPGNSQGPFGLFLSSSPTARVGLQVISEFGCISDTSYSSLKRKPVFEVELENPENCPPVEANMKVIPIDEIDQVAYNWNLGNGSTATGLNTSATYFDPNTTYDIQVISNSSLTGCSDTVFIPEAVFSYPVPIADFIPDPPKVLVSDGVINFENLSEGAVEYFWNFGDDKSPSTEYEPFHRYAHFGYYNVLLKVLNDYVCADSISKQVLVHFDKVFPPNAFSPNSPVEEDREFRIHADGLADEGCRLFIYNRWGEVIFESSSQEIGWEGKMRNGNFAPAGVYNWFLEYLDFKGDKHKQNGTVTLIFLSKFSSL